MTARTRDIVCMAGSGVYTGTGEDEYSRGEWSERRGRDMTRLDKRDERRTWRAFHEPIRTGTGSIMECRKRIYLYLSSILRGNILPVFFLFSFSPFFFSRSCLKSILIKCKSESSQPSRLFFRVEEFSLLLFFFYFRFSIFCKVFCAFNVKTCGLILGFDLSRPDQLYSLSSSLWIPTRISLMEILSNLFLLQAIFMYL